MRLLLILMFPLILFLGACRETTNTQSTPQLVDTAEDLEHKISEGMTLDQVYTLMTQELKNNPILYPAQDIYRQADGKWHFTAKDGGSPGDRDAPFQVLVFIPSPIGDPHYMIFFDNEKVFHDTWFEYSAALSIQKLLWTTETTD